MSQMSEGSQAREPMETPIETAETAPVVSPTTTTSKKSGSKRQKSVVWKHFTKVEISPGVYKDARCDHCDKTLNWSNNSGTSSLGKHLRSACPNFRLDNDSSTSSYRSPRVEYKFDQLKSRRDLAVACIKHNYPFNIGDHDYFEAFLNGLNPDFKLPSRNTIRADVIDIFEEEKRRIYTLLDNLTCKVSLTTDLSALPLSGDLLHVRCSAHILNLIVQDGLGEVRVLLDDIRKTVRYLERTPSAMQKFERAKQQCKLQDRKAVAIDVPTRWNSTFELLETALPLREAFVRLEQIDQGYLHNPPAQEWDTAAIVVECLRTFYEATNLFSGSKYPTSNVFFPTVCDIHLKLIEWEKSEHECLRNMCVPMKRKFDKYWEECNLVLAVAVVFDPTCKIHIVEYFYTQIYGEDVAVQHMTRVRKVLDDLYVLYGGSCGRGASSSSSVGSSSVGAQRRGFDSWYDKSHASTLHQSELETYMNELKLPQDDKFDVLNWWSINATRLPILAKIARDILAVPATTVASESAFSLGGRIIDEARSKLSPDAVEALVLANDWIRPLKEHVHRRIPHREVLDTISEDDECEA